MPKLRKTNERWNKRKRPEYIEWVHKNFKDSKLRVLLDLQYGLDRITNSNDVKRKILGDFESKYIENGIPNPVTKAAIMIRNGFHDMGSEAIVGEILKIYNLAPNVFSNNKKYLNK